LRQWRLATTGKLLVESVVAAGHKRDIMVKLTAKGAGGGHTISESTDGNITSNVKIDTGVATNDPGARAQLTI
jgi:D-tyrosyl-tRNA(Tyr) deacylase